MSKSEHLKSALLLFGSYSFAVSVSKLIYELGHGVYIWLNGGSVWWNINPFGTVYGEISGIVNLDVSVFHWGGTISATLMGLILLYLLRPQHNRYFAPLIMLGVVNVLFSGGNLLPGALVGSIGDASRLIAIGVSRWSVILISIAILALGVYLAVRYMVPLTDLDPDDPLWSYLLVFIGGFDPYSLLDLAFNYLRYHAWHKSLFFGAITQVIIVIIAILGKWGRQYRLLPAKPKVSHIIWPQVYFSLILDLVTVLFFLFVV